MFEKLTQYMDGFLKMGLPGYDCIVMKDGKCVFRHSNGYSDFENKTPISGKERYNLYSASKPITCVAAMQLWEKGLFSLDDKLSKFLPEFEEMNIQTENGLVKAKNPILISHLFEMTAGFDYATSSKEVMEFKKDTNNMGTAREFMKYLAKRPLGFEPGTDWKYSLCHDVIAVLIEVISGKRFGEYVKENIFDPLGMTHSTFLLPENELNSIAKQYRYFPETDKVVDIGPEIDEYKLSKNYESGGAGCISTLDDYVLFLEALREGEKLLKRSTIDLMRTNRIKFESDAPLLSTRGYGLGLRCQKNENDPLTEFGWGGAAGALLSVNPEGGYSFYYAQHMRKSPFQSLRGKMLTIVPVELGLLPETDIQIIDSVKPVKHDDTITY